MLGVVKCVRGGLVDRHGARMGGRIRIVAGMQGTGVKPERALNLRCRHSFLSIFCRLVPSCGVTHVPSLGRSASAPWRFADYGRGSVQATDGTEPRASASGQRLYANFRNLALDQFSSDLFGRQLV